MLSFPSIMMKRETFAVADILRASQTPGHARAKARGRNRTSMLDIGQQTPILVRADGGRFVLVEGLHRLEAAKALCETTIIGFRVEARKH
jgi:sulfiredoxin